MTNRLPLISVIIPTYNYGRFLPDAVKSVLGQKKDGLAVEIIVVDDGSTDDTADVAQRLGSSIQYVYQENQGPSAARNTGLRAATGDYLVFLDADDVLTRGVLESHLRLFAARLDIDISVCLSLQVFTENNGASYVWPLKATHLDLHLCHSNISPIHTFMLRAAVIRNVGLFDPGLQACEDQEYWLRCAALGKRMAANPHGLVVYRQHGGSLTVARPQLLAHDAAVRLKIRDALENRPDFPRAGKFMGWLAHAAGSLGSACNLGPSMFRLTQKLLEEGAQAALRAAALHEQAPAPGNAGLGLTEQYFAADFLLRARKFTTLSLRSLEKATGFLAKRHPTLAALGDAALQYKTEDFFHKICCDYDTMQATVKRTRLE